MFFDKKGDKMYNGAVLNGELNRILGNLRHTDRICIADCGLPIPDGVEVVDLSLKMGEPSFLSVLDVVLAHFGVEKVFLASETESVNPMLHAALQARFAGTPCETMPHEEFKKLSASCRAIVRTGEDTAYANLILQSSCIF